MTINGYSDFTKKKVFILALFSITLISIKNTISINSIFNIKKKDTNDICTPIHVMDINYNNLM